MKEFFRKNWKIVTIVAAEALAVILAVVLCVCLIPGGKDKLSTPANVKVSQDTLSWDSVENAEKGYTVKIGADETTSVLTTSLDLTTVTSKLTEGENKLSVKTNATDAFDASDYSEEVTYVYRTPFAAPTNLKIENGILSWNAVSGATTYIVSVVGNSTVQPVEVTSTSFNLAQFDLTEGATVKFSVKVKASGYKLESAAATTEDFVVPDYVDMAKTAIAEKKAEIDAITNDDEKIIKLVDEFEVLFNTYPDRIKTNTEVAEAFEELTDARTAAKTNIENAVDTLATAINDLLDNEYDENTVKATLTSDYNALLAKQGEVADLGAYGKKYWNETYSAKDAAITAKISAILGIAVESEDSVEAFVNGANGTVTILFRGVNILGDTITSTEAAPALTVTLDEGSADGVDTSDAAFSAKDGVFYYTSNFVIKPNTDGDPLEYRLKVTYTIAGTQKEVTFTEFLDNLYFSAENENPNNPDNFKAFQNGKIALSGEGAGGQVYFDIYESSVINRGESVPEITGFPLIRGVEVSNGMTEADFRRMLANDANYSKILLNKTYNVRFLAYTKSEDGKTTSNKKTALVSMEVYRLDLTEDDLRLDIFHVPSNDANKAPFNWKLENGGNAPDIKYELVDYDWAIINSQYKLWDEVNINIYDATDIANIQTYDFSEDTPFAVYKITGEGWVYYSYLEDAIRTAWEALDVADRKLNYTFVFAMQVEPNSAAKADGWLPSKLNYATENKAGKVRESRTMDMTKTIKNDVINNGIYGDAPYVMTLIGDNISNDWLAQFKNIVPNLSESNASDYFEVLIQTYLKSDTENVAFEIRVPFKNQGYSFNALTQAWSAQYFKNGGTDGVKVEFTVELSIALKDKVNGAANPLAEFFKTSEKVTAKATANDGHNCQEHTFNKADLTLPNELLFIKNGNNPNLFPILDGVPFRYSDIVINNYATLQLYVSTSADGANAKTFYVVYEKVNHLDSSKGDAVVILKNATDELSTGLVFERGGNEYWNSNINGWFNTALGVTNFDFAGEGWYFSTEFIDNPDDDTYLYGGGKSEWTTFMKPVQVDKKDDPVPTGNQIQIAANDSNIITFMEPTTDGNASGRGWVLYHGANYIVVKFQINGQGTEYTAYLIPNLVNPEAKLKLYANTDKSGPALDCDRVNNGWVNIDGDDNTFISWIRSVSAYSGIPEEITKIKFSTAIYSDGEGNYVSSDGTGFSSEITWTKPAQP